MQNLFLAVILCVLYLGTGICADDDIKRGVYPFMAFIYYQDESIIDGTGSRLLQSAFLVRPEFLISSALVSTISEDPLSKTLLARLGATHIDANFTLNEDEDEQEQEVIEIITPYQLNKTSWWLNDIALLKTLQPFKETSAVRVTQLSTNHDFSGKICQMLVFKNNGAELGWSLAPFSVELMPALKDNCGEQFDERTMTCGMDSQSLDAVKSPPQNFCQGNNGGPLLCDGDVMALQTYINGNCKPPYRYHLLASWKNFLTCGIKEQCDDKETCPNVCSVALKDSPLTGVIVSSTANTTYASEAGENVEKARNQGTVDTKDKPTTEPLAGAQLARTNESTNSDLTNKNKVQKSRKMLDGEEMRDKNEPKRENTVRTMTLRENEPQTRTRLYAVASGGVTRNNSGAFISMMCSCFLVWICLG